jgi:hypothetical protein
MALNQARLRPTVSSQPNASTERKEFYSAVEIPAETQARRQQRIRFLRTGDERHKRLADELSGCEKGRRCKSEADPVCVALFWQKVWRELRGTLAGRPWTRALVIPSGLMVPYGQLGKFDLMAAAEQFRKRLERSSLHDRVIVGAIDIFLRLKNDWGYIPT